MTLLMPTTFALAAIALRTPFRVYAKALGGISSPWTAKYTRFWLSQAINSRSYHDLNFDLHRLYWPIVRSSPSEDST